MSIVLSDNDRRVVNEALRTNSDLLRLLKTNMQTQITADEMYEVTLFPYDPKLAKPGVETLDRYSWSCYGNNSEVVAALTLMYHDWIKPHDIEFVRDKNTQVVDMIDLITHSFNCQVKPALRGNSKNGLGDGQYFVSRDDMNGKANYLTYVDGRFRTVVMINSGKFKNELEVMDRKLPADSWKGKSGWFVTPEEFESVIPLFVPTPIATTYYDGERVIILRESDE